MKYLYIYLDKTNGQTIAIKGSTKPRKSKRMKVVYDFNVDKGKYCMAIFPEIFDSVLFSDRFVYLGRIGTKILY